MNQKNSCAPLHSRDKKQNCVNAYKKKDVNSLFTMKLIEEYVGKR